MADLTRLDLTVSEDDADRATGLMVRRVSFGWEELPLPDRRICFRLHTDNPVLIRNIRQEAAALLPTAVLETASVPSCDWTSAWKEFFTPVPAGNWLILPPWLQDTDCGNLQPIIIDPKSAFGTGHHATTVLCLEALGRLLNAGELQGQVLDLGTGTGILGIACALSGLRVTGTDIDPVAVSNAEENIVRNLVADRMTVLSGSTDAVSGQSWDVIVANILAGPLREMAPEIMTLLHPGGRLILSGILGIQANDVTASYAALGSPKRYDQGEWACLVW